MRYRSLQLATVLGALLLVAGQVFAWSSITVRDSSRSTIGYIDSDGTLRDGSRSTIGYVESDGTVRSSSRSFRLRTFACSI